MYVACDLFLHYFVFVDKLWPKMLYWLCDWPKYKCFPAWNCIQPVCELWMSLPPCYSVYIPFVPALAFRRNVVVTLALENQIPLFSKMAVVWVVLLSVVMTSVASAMTSMPSSIRVTNLPDFVGFSYSRASPSPPSNRFIHFLNEVRIGTGEYNEWIRWVPNIK